MHHKRQHTKPQKRHVHSFIFLQLNLLSLQVYIDFESRYIDIESRYIDFKSR